MGRTGVAVRAMGIAINIMLCTAPSPAQPAEPAQPCTPRTLSRPRNAALAYWRAWDAVTPELQGAIDAGFNGREHAWAPDEQAAARLALAQSVVEGLVDAAAIDACDFGVDQSTGVRRSLPHIARMRDASRLLVADCRRLMDSGQHEPAARRILALLQMSRHLAHDLSSTSALSGQGFAIMACDEVLRLGERASDRRALADTPSGPALLSHLRSLASEPDPFSLAPAIEHEGSLLRCWVARAFPGEHAGRDLLASIELLGLPQQLHEQISAMDSPALVASASRCAEFFTAASAHFLEPDAPARLAGLEEKVLAGEFGPLAPIFAPRLSAAAPSRDQARQAIARALELLADPPAGSPAPASGTDQSK